MVRHFDAHQRRKRHRSQFGTAAIPGRSATARGALAPGIRTTAVASATTPTPHAATTTSTIPTTSPVPESSREDTLIAHALHYRRLAACLLIRANAVGAMCSGEGAELGDP